MNVGELITVNVKPITTTVIASVYSQVECKVVATYPKFIVLDNGKYRFCAFRDELERNEVIAV